MSRLSLSRLWRALAVIVLLAGLTGLAFTVHQAQAESRNVLQARFQVRGDIAARFAHSYVSEIFSRERAVASAHFGAARVSQRQLQIALDSFGFTAAVLLDVHGRLLAVSPASPRLLGHAIGPRYAHLRAALTGRTAVSQVVLSAALGVPIVAFATPFSTPYGRRVFSGGFDVGRTPLGSYLHNALPYAGSHIYLIDHTGTIVASNLTFRKGMHSLASAGIPLSRLTAQPQGTFQDRGTDTYFVVRRVPGTPWRIVLSIPVAMLFASVSGLSLWLPWVLFALFVLGSLSILWLLFRYAQSRTHLVLLNRELDFVARVDGLTGAYNRRQLEENLAREVARETRHGGKAGFILLDLDRFKRINDTYGHQVGDAVLQQTVQCLRQMVRVVDTVYRYGGEEFAVLVPDTDRDGALVVAERIRQGIAEQTFGEALSLTASLGVALIPSDACTPVDVIEAADQALYEAKHNGGNRTILSRNRQLAESQV